MQSFKFMDPEALIFEILEAIELAASCADCGRPSLPVLLNRGDCPYCRICCLAPPAET
jgi:hypothetical protein